MTSYPPALMSSCSRALQPLCPLSIVPPSSRIGKNQVTSCVFSLGSRLVCSDSLPGSLFTPSESILALSNHSLIFSYCHSVIVSCPHTPVLLCRHELLFSCSQGLALSCVCAPMVSRSHVFILSSSHAPMFSCFRAIMMLSVCDGL